MTIKKKLVFILLLLLLLFNIGYSQKIAKGYILNNEGNIVNGYISLPSEYAGLCYFKKDLSDKETIIIEAKDVSRIILKKDQFVATKINLGKDTVLFSRLIYDGNYDLMFSEVDGYKWFFIARPDGNAYTIRYPPALSTSDIFSGINSDMKFKQQTDTIFPEEFRLPEYRNGIKPEISSFIKLFEEYHQVTNSTSNKGSVIIDPKFKDFSEGYIVNNNNDTINGYVNDVFKRSFSDRCIFKTSKKEKLVPFTSEDIQGFGSRKKNIFFGSVNSPLFGKNNPIFVRLMLEGELDLLYYELSRTKNFLLRDNQGRISALSYPPIMTNADYLSGLNSERKFRLIADSLIKEFNLQQSAGSVKPELKSMLNLLKEYHISNEQPFKIYNGNPPVFEIGPVAGTRLEKYHTGIINDDSKSFFELAPYGGFNLRIIDKKTRTGFVFSNAISYNRNKYSYTINKEDHSVFSQTSITSLAYNADAGFTFNPLKKTLPLSYIDIGGAFRYFMNPDYETLTNKVYTEDNIVMSYIDNNIRDSKFFYGGFLRAGVSRNLKKNIISISGGYYYLLSNSSTTIHSFDISLLYTIRFR